MSTSPQPPEIEALVKSRYGDFAESGGQHGACCGAQEISASGVALESGLYTREQLALVPDGALRLSRGCGNPTSFASLVPGETVVDFGCGAGVDVILAAHEVGAEGHVVGVDFTPRMVERARENVAEAGLSEDTVTLRVAALADTGLEDACTDIVISNCAINLSADKDAVYREAFRVLRPGGRLAISDVALSHEIHAGCRARLRAGWVGCLGGAIPEDDYLHLLRRSGFSSIQVVARDQMPRRELEALSRCPGPGFVPAVAPEDLAAALGKVVTVKLTATKAMPQTGIPYPTEPSI